MAEVTDKNKNYTPEMLERMVAMYLELGNEGITEIADSLGRTVRSVRSKLVREGIYVASPKGAATKSEGPSKKELLREIEAKGFDTEGCDGANQIALTRLLGLVSN